MDWSAILTFAFLSQVLAAGLRLATPLIFTALGEIFAERSGVLNLGVEGIMLFCGFAGFSAAVLTGSLWMGVLAGILMGALMGLLFALMTVTLQTDQIVTGLAFLILSSGAAIYFYRILFGSYRIFPTVSPFRQFSVPILSKIPFLGPILFEQNILTLVMLGLVPICAVILTATRFGLRVSAVGEHPAAADTVGVNVLRIRYICVVIGGALAGLGGAYFPLAELGFYSNSMIGGRGFIALALVVFGRWNPLLALGGGFLFGVINALQIRIQFLGSTIPAQFLIMLPYLLTILVMLVGRARQAPSALTVPYKRA
jgi:general nucleoside transport system permease protein